MTVRFAQEAQYELDDAFAYLAKIDPALADRFIAAVTEALGRVERYPTAWHPIGHNFRRCHLKVFSYGLIYRIRDDAIEIIALAHDRQRLGYWRKRGNAD